MTESDSNPGNDPAARRSDPQGAVNDLPSLTPEAEAEVRAILASLPSVTMPVDVQARINQALADEPNPYAVPAAGSATNVTSINRRAHRRNKWFVAAAGVAAVGVLGVAVGSTLMTDSSNPPLTTAAVPMSQSGTVYQKGGVATAVSKAWPTWRSAATESQQASSTLSPSTTTEPVSTATATTSATPLATETTSAEVASSVRDQVSKCLQRVDPRPPMHVDIAAYRTLPTGPNEPVAVAVVRSDGSMLDVYVLDVDCVGSMGDIVREHLTLAEPSQ